MKVDSLKKIKKAPKKYGINNFLRKLHFTLDINSISLIAKDDVVKYVSFDLYKDVESYYFPPFDIWQKKNYLDTIKENITEFIDFKSNAKYYTADSDSIYLYKVFYLKSSAVRVRIDKDPLLRNELIGLELLWNKLIFWSEVIDQRIPALYGYLLYNIHYISGTEPPAGFVEWDYMNDIYPPGKEIDWYKEMDWYELDDDNDK